MILRGPFWWTRDLMGLKRTLVMLYKDPALLEEILDHYLEFHLKVLPRALTEVEVDYVVFNEDMAYKSGPMISPETFREYMSPVYYEICKLMRSYGVKVLMVDSDGNVEPLIPKLLKVGINSITPCEVATGMNVVKLRRRYPNLVMMGGLDKRKLAKGFMEIEEEVYRKVPLLVRTKGYFPA